MGERMLVSRQPCCAPADGPLVRFELEVYAEIFRTDSPFALSQSSPRRRRFFAVLRCRQCHRFAIWLAFLDG